MRAVTESRQFKLPFSLEVVIRERVKHLGFNLDDPRQLADAVRTLSNLFIRGGASLGYWHVPAMRAAYTAYFMPLNFLRARAVCMEAARLYFFDHARVVEDWGCGLGAASWALLLALEPTKSVRLAGIDQSEDALAEFQAWSERFMTLQGNWPSRLQVSTRRGKLEELVHSKADTFIMSYVLAEMSERPELPSTAERLIVIEPSTHQQGRSLLEFRQELLEKGWYAWAPCTHQYDCPLLTGSGRDWCHDRISWEKPEWYAAIEQHLPMKNDTLTMSYVVFSKERPPEKLVGLTRVVGDQQEEQGKSRQLICRSPKREFMSWLHRDRHDVQLHRGDLIKVEGLLSKSNEARMTSESTVQIIDFEPEPLKR